MKKIKINIKMTIKITLGDTKVLPKVWKYQHPDSARQERRELIL